MHRQTGQTLVELLVSMAIVGMMAGISVNAVETARKRTALGAATAEMRALFHSTRALAIAHDRNVALKFERDGETWRWTTYVDGDGDGVRSDDIRRGVDRQLGRTRRFLHKPVRIGVPANAPRDPYSGALLSAREPVRFGTSTLCSFSRVGEATNGSLVMTDGRNVVVVRVHGTSARISVLRWDGTGWRERA